MLQKVKSSQASEAVTLDNSEPEQVINIIERPSQLAMTAAVTRHHLSHTVPVIPPPPPPSSQPARQSSRVPAAAAAAPGDVAQPQGDVNRQLVERIEELYRQIHRTQTDDLSAPAAV